MFYHIIKILLAIGLALSIYFIGAQGCSPNSFLSLETIPCEEMQGVENCIGKNIFSPADDLRTRLDSDDSGAKPDSDDSRAKPDSDNSRAKGATRRKRSPKREKSTRPRAPSQPMCEMNYDVSLGEVLIIFVMDVSSSMAVEHRNIGSQLSPFLGDIKDVRYYVAVITMDISSSPDNPFRNAYFQDGRFIPIAGKLFLTNENIGNRPSERVISSLAKAIELKETRNCDKGENYRSRGKYDELYDNRDSVRCPSHDERGTYALNLAVQNPRHRSFFKPGRPLIIIPVSDEDIRSSSDYIDQYGHEDYEWENMDYPEVLLENIYNRLGKNTKVSFYPIIISPGDKQCLERQNKNSDRGEGTGRGYYGKTWAWLARASDSRYGNLLKGSVISICRKNYSSQLKQVSVAAQTIRVPLSCGNPTKIELFANNRRLKASHRIEGRTLLMEPGTVRLNSKLSVKIVCPGRCQ